MTRPVCPHQPSCPGCPRLHLSGLAPQPVARLVALAEQAGLPPPTLHPSPLTGFRHRARLSIRGRADAPKLGIFEAGSHRAVHIPHCLVHHPVINRVASKLRDTLARNRVPTYSDSAHLGVARYVQIVVERQTERAQVTLVTNDHEPTAHLPLFSELEQALGQDLGGLWWNGNPARTNTILGPRFEHLAGERCVHDFSGKARIFYPPGAFGQSNLPLAMDLGAQVRSLARPGSRVTELYAGVGAIGLGLAESVAELHLNELSAGSLQGLALGVAALREEQRARVHVHEGTAASFAHLVGSSDVVVADPPRKGLDPQVVAALLSNPPERFVYVSCDIDSFERDQKALAASLSLESLAAYDLFPHTEHLETLSVFARR